MQSGFVVRRVAWILVLTVACQLLRIALTGRRPTDARTCALRRRTKKESWKLYLSHPLGGYTVGLQDFERGYRVWFFHVLLGTFVPGTHETLQPAVADDASAT